MVRAGPPLFQSRPLAGQLGLVSRKRVQNLALGCRKIWHPSVELALRRVRHGFGRARRNHGVAPVPVYCQIGLSGREAWILTLIAESKTGPGVFHSAAHQPRHRAQAHQPHPRKARRRNPHCSGCDGAVGNFVRKRRTQMNATAAPTGDRRFNRLAARHKWLRDGNPS